MTPELRSLLLEYLNRGIREVLSVDPDTAREFSRLQGKTFRLEVTLPPITLDLVPDPDGFSLLEQADTEPDVILSGPITTFLHQAGLGRNIQGSVGEQIRLQGEIDAGLTLQKLFSRFDFDWEELLARRMGDLPARRFAKVIRGMGSWAGESVGLARENFADFLAEERQLAVSQTAFSRFEGEVDRLRADTDRVAERVERLLSERGIRSSRD